MQNPVQQIPQAIQAMNNIEQEQTAFFDEPEIQQLVMPDLLDPPRRRKRMAHIGRLLFWRHMRADPNQHILHFQRGELVREGPGVAYWFNPLSAAIANVPVEDCETTFLFRERSLDFQEVTVQCTLIYRIVDPKKAAQRINFSIDLRTGVWVEQPLERLSNLWTNQAQHPARAYLKSVPVEEAMREGAEVIRQAIVDALKKDPEIEEMGLTVVNLQVVRVAPAADVEKALETPTRESIQQKADEAGFARRANAVEKERAIKENELQTEIELAQRQEELIGQQGKNNLRGIENEAESEKARVVALVERQAVEAEAHSKQVAVRATGDAEAIRIRSAAHIETEQKRVDVYRDAPSKVLVGLSLQELAQKIQSIQHLNVTPDMLGDTFKQFLRDQSA